MRRLRTHADRVGSGCDGRRPSEGPRLHTQHVSNRCLRARTRARIPRVGPCAGVAAGMQTAPASLQRARRAAAAGKPAPAQGTPGRLPQGTPGVPLPQAVPSRPSALDLRAAASELPQLRSLLVSWRGELIAEHYARGARPSGLANIKSASKSIIAALVGIAIERGLIKGVQRADRRLLPRAARGPRLPQAVDHHRGSAHDALGPGVDERPNYGAWVQSPNWVRFGAGAADGRRAWRRDGVQHRQLASVVRDSHEGDAHQHLAVRAGQRWPGHSGSRWRAGRRIRRASTSAATRCCSRRSRWWRSASCTCIAAGQRPPDRPGVVGRHVVRAADVSAYDSERLYGYGWWIQQFEGGTPASRGVTAGSTSSCSAISISWSRQPHRPQSARNAADTGDGCCN